MSLNAKDYKQESKFERPDPLEPGTYPARVIQILSLGLQKQRPYKGEEKKPAHMLYVMYEFLDEFMKDEDGEDLLDKPRWLSEDFTMNSLDSDLAKSTKRYLALDPELKFDGDWSQLAGAACMVTVTQTKSKKDANIIYNNIASVQTMRAKEAAKAPELKNPPKVFDIDSPDIELFLSLPKWLQDRMKENLEFGGSALEEAITQHEKGGTNAKDKSKGNRGKVAEKSEEDSGDDDDASEDDGNW